MPSPTLRHILTSSSLEPTNRSKMLNSLHLMVTSLLLSSIAPLSTEPTQCSHLATVDLGSVDLASNPKCDSIMTSKLDDCIAGYEEKVREAASSAQCRLTETVRRISCCGVWQAKNCLADIALDYSDCGRNVSDLYRALPSDAIYKAKVADMCSEYMEDSNVCNYHPYQGGFTHHNLILTLLILFIVFVVIMIALKVKQHYSARLDIDVHGERNEKSEEMKTMINNNPKEMEHADA